MVYSLYDNKSCKESAKILRYLFKYMKLNVHVFSKNVSITRSQAEPCNEQYSLFISQDKKNDH